MLLAGLEALDLAGGSGDGVEAVREIHLRKTAALLAASAELGALAALGRRPGDDLVRVCDIACLAMYAILGIYLQPMSSFFLNILVYPRWTVMDFWAPKFW